MVEMLAELIAGILGLIKKGDFENAESSLNQVYNDFLNEDASFFLNIPIENLTDQLLKKHEYTNGHMEILSELFYIQAELLSAQGRQQDSVEFYSKSLVLLEFVMKRSGTFSFEKQNRLAYLKQQTV
jgi:hypothetical protein